MKTYALTLGPIVETITMGRKTSEIWMASYLFSWTMKNIIGKLRMKEGVRFMIPYVDDDSLFEECDGGIGMFHDRFILQSDTLSLDEIETIVDETIDELAALIGISDEEEKQALRSYIQTYILESDKKHDNAILELSAYLDAMECHTPPSTEGDEVLRRFLRRDVLLRSELAKKSFGKKPSFASIPAIAAQEEDKDDIEKNDAFKNAYRYIAIVHADGDNLGKVIKATDDFTAFSKKLFDFGQKARETLETFEAQTLFIGGDDLLFFAPVLYKDKGTIFDLIDALSRDYAEALGDERTTLSFGVSVTYFKYPLYEALERSRNALFDRAKRHPGKNAVALSIQKHSGQSFEFVVGKQEALYDTFKELLEDVLEGKTELPHSVHHKLDLLDKLLEHTPKEKERLEAIFENFFNEEVHQQKFSEGLEKLQKLLQVSEIDEESRKRLFAMLSTIKLLRGDR